MRVNKFSLLFIVGVVVVVIGLMVVQKKVVLLGEVMQVNVSGDY